MSAAPSPAFPAVAAPADVAGSRRSRRLTALAVAAACGGILGLAAYLEPAPGGLGTHQQLNLPACGWITLMDVPCPTCGMTTAFAHAANGNLLASAAAQPLGAVLALATAMALVVAVYVVLTGSRVGSVFARMWGRSTGWILAAAAVLAWGYKVLSYKGLL